MPTPNYAEVSRLVRAAFAEYRRVDSDGDAETFADFVDGVLGDEVSRFLDRRIEAWPLGELRTRVERLRGLHKAIGYELDAMIARAADTQEAQAGP
jgi:hypothetical protein